MKCEMKFKKLMIMGGLAMALSYPMISLASGCNSDSFEAEKPSPKDSDCQNGQTVHTPAPGGSS